ncbi:hypothetical protein Fcan01_08852 [Folsomia candida]|uniref:Uncharacterized protein n=1 Tax=Folsomia candida TaxID=158441 RepID=A0A226EGN0_FOLCA|nr:hypothetical protein Fcan01_08852 [Folsomia candida]
MLPLNNSNAIVESTSGEHDHAPKDKCGEFLRLRHQTPKSALSNHCFNWSLEAESTKLSTPPDDQDKAFVVASSFDYEDKWFGVLMSKPRFPLNVIGISDKDKKFHPIFFGVAKGETQQDYAFNFSAIKTTLPGYTPNKNVVSKQNLVRDKELWRNMKNDITQLQLARSSKDFEAAK